MKAASEILSLNFNNTLEKCLLYNPHFTISASFAIFDSKKYKINHLA